MKYFLSVAFTYPKMTITGLFFYAIISFFMIKTTENISLIGAMLATFGITLATLVMKAFSVYFFKEWYNKHTQHQINWPFLASCFLLLILSTISVYPVLSLS